jgi:transketolase
MKDRYAESGSPAQLLEKYGLTADGIIREVRAVLKRKKV